MNGSEILKALERHFPSELAYEWDNVGLMVGTMNKEVSTILVTLDVTKDTLKEAIRLDADLIISHHPLIFSPLKRLHLDTYKGALIEGLIKHDIAVFSAHTNYDLANGGMNDMLAGRLGLRETTHLEATDPDHGIGRIGSLPGPLSIEAAIKHIKQALQIDHARYIGNKKDKTVRTVAISGGSGADHAVAAKKKGADLYVTGDVSYHEAHDMMQLGLRALDVGHTAEKHFKQAMKTWLESLSDNVTVHAYAPDQDPFTHV